MDVRDRSRLWGDGERLELLPVRQSSAEPGARSHLALLLPARLTAPTTLAAAPSSFGAMELIFPFPLRNGAALAARLSLCRLASPASVRQLHCLEPWPIRVEPLPQGLRVEPLRSLQDGAPYAFAIRIRNPLGQGAQPLRLYGVRADAPRPVYLGTWLLEIFSGAE